MWLKFFIIFLILPSFGYSQQNVKIRRDQRKSHVLLNEIIASPDLYHGKKISIFGHLVLESDNYSLSTHGCEKANKNAQGMIWVELAKSKNIYKSNADGKDFYLNLLKFNRFHNSCVWITGIFDKENTGHWGDFSGRVRNISSIVKKMPR